MFSHIFHSSAGRNRCDDFTVAAVIALEQSIPLAGRLTRCRKRPTRRFSDCGGVYCFIGTAIVYRGEAGFHSFRAVFCIEGIGKGTLLAWVALI